MEAQRFIKSKLPKKRISDVKFIMADNAVRDGGRWSTKRGRTLDLCDECGLETYYTNLVMKSRAFGYRLLCNKCFKGEEKTNKGILRGA